MDDKANGRKEDEAKGSGHSNEADTATVPTAKEDEKDAVPDGAVAARASSSTEDASTVEGGSDETVTMLDVLEDEKELEEDAAAVLGAADDKNCTYMTGGYVKRQPLYSCLTCIPAEKGKEGMSKKCGGVCLACSYKCHEGHDLIELYTKASFRSLCHK
jgi:E3 ubiquitin-protein ligase UBR7